jgi:nucleoside-diphosphate-sugar epimerase
MKLFVTGASGWIGSAVVPELLGAGHEVVGLARSEASAIALEAIWTIPRVWPPRRRRPMA